MDEPAMRPVAHEITREDLTMAHVDPLLERNKHFATTNAREGRRDPRRGSRRPSRGDRPPGRRAAALQHHPAGTITVSGHVYDVNTGLITTIVPAAPMPAAPAESA
jgi:hypothetical protein